MAQQLVEIEEMHTERLRAAIEDAEEIQDKKIELLTKSMRHSMKRKRMQGDDDDGERAMGGGGAGGAAGGGGNGVLQAMRTRLEVS